MSDSIRFVFGPKDGGDWDDDAPYPGRGTAILLPTALKAKGWPLLARYLEAQRYKGGEPDGTVLLFDGWYVEAPGEEYGPRVGGMKISRDADGRHGIGGPLGGSF